MVDRRTVVLYSPHFVAPAWRSGALYRATPPLSHLALAGPLREAGYDVQIVDAKWDVDWRSWLRNSADRLLCAGVTSLTGPAVSDGLEFATFVKQLRPDLPIIWGGWHASFAAQQAMEDPRVDIVVRGMGERTFVEVVRAVAARSPLRNILGIHYHDGGKIASTPDRPLEDINNFPPPSYDLIKPERYVMEVPGGGRQAFTIFSRGCPFACDFCLDSKNPWVGLSIDRMMDDLEFWVGHGANRVLFFDGNFFLGRARLIEFCDALLARDLPSRMRWIATAVGRRVAKMDDELLVRLKRAGLMQVAIGAESGSDELLTRITNKTTVETTLEAVRRLTRHGINQHLFFMVGYPDEPVDALESTLDFVLTLKKINPDVTLFLNYVTPLPGSEVFRIAVDRGHVEAPRSFEDWARFDYTQPNLLDTSDQYRRRVSRFQQFLSLAYPVPGRTRLPASLRRFARWRLENRHLGFPLELSLLSAFHSVRAIASRS
jgi:anaerobic magnesium-protoporphyrin IX monomethyl ester cyclase